MPAVRRAVPAELDDVTDTLWLAFGEDPLWRWAFPDHLALRPWWRFLIDGALAHGWVWVTEDHGAASVWIPPGAEEIPPEREGDVEPLLRELLADRAGEVLALLERFGETHPPGPRHFYLSLLGVRPEQRGRGLGMKLLAENLRLIDAERAPAYLESSNPANVHRYEGLGFSRRGEFSTPDGAHRVTTMWREPAAQ